MSFQDERIAAARAYREKQQDKAALTGFANTAMRAILEHPEGWRQSSEDVATNALDIADAMLAELRKRTNLDDSTKGKV